MFNDNGSFLLALFEFFLFFAWFMCLFWVIGDIFRSRDLSGVAKTFWVFFVIILPWLGILVYLIARGHGMQQRQLEQAQEMQCGADGVHPVRRRIVGWLIGRPDRLGEVAAGLRRHHAGRVRGLEGEGARLIRSDSCQAHAEVLVTARPWRPSALVDAVAAFLVWAGRVGAPGRSRGAVSCTRP